MQLWRIQRDKIGLVGLAKTEHFFISGLIKHHTYLYQGLNNYRLLTSYQEIWKPEVFEQYTRPSLWGLLSLKT